jgi:hypothetical protein
VSQRIALAVALALAAALAAWLVRRRQAPEAPTQPRYGAPAQLDRADFARPDAPWLVALFSSATCSTCADMRGKVAALASGQVAVEDVEVGARADVHRRYAIEAVPIVCIADAHGVVRASFVGPCTATDLWAAVAEARSPGSSPEPGLGRPGPA